MSCRRILVAAVLVGLSVAPAAATVDGLDAPMAGGIIATKDTGPAAAVAAAGAIGSATMRTGTGAAQIGGGSGPVAVPPAVALFAAAVVLLGFAHRRRQHRAA